MLGLVRHFTLIIFKRGRQIDVYCSFRVILMANKKKPVLWSKRLYLQSGSQAPGSEPKTESLERTQTLKRMPRSQISTFLLFTNFVTLVDRVGMM
jgi:hypothetical protein